MTCIYLPEVDSTNSYLIRLLEAGNELIEGTTFYTSCQNRGRGQLNNSWESEPGCNLAFSMLLKPTFLPLTEAFVLSELTALAIADTLNAVLPGFTIKWPNDIYHDDRKAVGILIENRLSGKHIQQSIIGVGVNLNQRVFRSDAPNPVSLRQLLIEAGRGEEPISIEGTLHEIVRRLMADYRQLRAEYLAATAPTTDNTEGRFSVRLHRRYMAHLYRRPGIYPYQDSTTGIPFRATIEEVAPSGALQLRTEVGETRSYMFKEVKFCLPCGVVKE
jgi:BirA family biotin operon repressor/biotin-[acetyl-CoA-carboxylase] ligase